MSVAWQPPEDTGFVIMIAEGRGLVWRCFLGNSPQGKGNSCKSLCEQKKPESMPLRP